MGSINTGLVPDALLDLREKALTEKPVVSRARYFTPKRLREKTLTKKTPLSHGLGIAP